MTPDLKEITIDELNPFEGDPSLILTENPDGLWKKIPFIPSQGSNDRSSFLTFQDNKIINKPIPFDFINGVLTQDLPFPKQTGSGLDWVVNWDVWEKREHGMIEIVDKSKLVLQPGYLYKLTAWLSGFDSTGSSKPTTMTYQWYNNTIPGWCMFPAFSTFNVANSHISLSPAITFVNLTHPTDQTAQEIVLKVTSVDASGPIDNISAGSTFSVEAMP